MCVASVLLEKRRDRGRKTGKERNRYEPYVADLARSNPAVSSDGILRKSLR